MTGSDLSPDVVVRFTKWGGSDHWTFRATRIGEDEHGIWVAAPIGTPFARPGMEFTAERNQVFVFPRDRPYTTAFYQPLADDDADHVSLYVDITTVPFWQGDEVTMSDLDLDVVRYADGRVSVEDEEEFVLHQQLLRYPPEVVALAHESVVARLSEVRKASEPFGIVGTDWLRRVFGS